MCREGALLVEHIIGSLKANKKKGFLIVQLAKLKEQFLRNILPVRK